MNIPKTGPPPLTGAYASLISNNLDDTGYSNSNAKIRSDIDELNQ